MMNKLSLMEKVLGESWQSLPAVIQKHYQLYPSQNTRNVVIGQFFVDFPWFINPLLKAIRLFGGLIDLKGKDMTARVEKWVQPDLPDVLFWRRQITLPSGKSILFSSRMEYQQANEIIEYIGCGFGLHLNVTVEDGKLVYRSNGHLWQCGRFRLPIPDALVLGHATIIETALSDNQFALDFRIEHPVCGLTYHYGGVFDV